LVWLIIGYTEISKKLSSVTAVTVCKLYKNKHTATVFCGRQGNYGVENKFGAAAYVAIHIIYKI